VGDGAVDAMVSACSEVEELEELVLGCHSKHMAGK
jgi:hypothetical protein